MPSWTSSVRPTGSTDRPQSRARPNLVEPEPELLSVGHAANRSDLDDGAGNFAAIESFVAARQHRLLRCAHLITGDLPLAQDLLQDALIKLALHWPKIHSDAESYVRTVLYRDPVSWWRRRRREFATAIVPDRGVRDTAEESTVRMAFANALALLTTKQRAVLVLRYFEDQSVEAAAELLGVSEGTVKEPDPCGAAAAARGRAGDLATNLPGGIALDARRTLKALRRPC